MTIFTAKETAAIRKLGAARRWLAIEEDLYAVSLAMVRDSKREVLARRTALRA
jgi:hypothetical protein